ncbi:hypothetical protein EYR36_009510 [Pleurotus pulmonarius]|nr:hypothetical protein EYR36_009510 [Pleurotus pulmonarius]
MQAVPLTEEQRSYYKMILRPFLSRQRVPRGVKQPTVYDMGLGKELPQDLKGKISFRLQHSNGIGRGGYAKVFKGTYKPSWRGHKVMVALKFLELPYGPDVEAKSVQYLHRETAVWRTLKHPNILALLGICSGLKYPMSTVPALVSPYCPLGSLGKFLMNTPLVHRLPLARQIASAVDYIHAQDIVHGDIKPENIMMDGECRPLLCDFGRSMIIGVSGFETALASSLQYTAPELLNSRTEMVTLTKPSDIYSLTVTLLRVFTNRTPFHPDDGPYIVRLLGAGQRPTIDTYLDCPEMSEALWEIFNVGWACDPSHRLDARTYTTRLDALPPTSPSIIPE